MKSAAQGHLASDRLDPCSGAGSQEPSQAPSRVGMPLSERELGSGIEAGQVCNCGSPGTVGRESSAATVLLDSMLEKEWDALLFGSQKGLAPMLGWRPALSYHTLHSKGSQSGFPDRVLIRDRLIFAELKRDKGKPTEAQKEWLNGLASAGAEVYLWRPSDLDEIATILSKRWKFEIGLDGRRRLRSELTSYAPQSLWVSGVGRVDEAVTPIFRCVVDESAGLADASPP